MTIREYLIGLKPDRSESSPKKHLKWQDCVHFWELVELDEEKFHDRCLVVIFVVEPKLRGVC